MAAQPPSGVEPSRVRVLVDRPPRPQARYVLYWMQQSQRALSNPALEYAVGQAGELGLPVLVGFGLTAYPEANARHYDFMLRGLAEVRARLAERGIGFVIRKARPDRVALDLARDAAMVVCDRGYLRAQRAWREALAKDIDRRLVQVEGDVVVPVEAASHRRETAARTLRPRLTAIWDGYLNDPPPSTVRRPIGADVPASDVDLADVGALVASLKVDQTVAPVRRFTPGEGAARARLAAFLEDGLSRYGAERGRPEAHAVSGLSPYLHFGQISPVEIAVAARRAGSGSESVRVFLDELIVRRELAANHVVYEPDYDRYESLPAWARKTLAERAGEPRPYLYDEGAFERGETHDAVWNAAMLEMRATGYMHNRLRMYWGKKVLQWSASPEAAFEILLRLNNRWFLDGRDASSFANVGWIFGLHDRPFFPQPVFGLVRAMGAASLKTFDARAYVAEVERLAAAER